MVESEPGGSGGEDCAVESEHYETCWRWNEGDRREGLCLDCVHDRCAFLCVQGGGECNIGQVVRGCCAEELTTAECLRAITVWLELGILGASGDSLEFLVDPA